MPYYRVKLGDVDVAAESAVDAARKVIESGIRGDPYVRLAVQELHVATPAQWAVRINPDQAGDVEVVPLTDSRRVND